MVDQRLRLWRTNPPICQNQIYEERLGGFGGPEQRFFVIPHDALAVAVPDAQIDLGGGIAMLRPRPKRSDLVRVDIRATV